jgi:hypothetical protein
MGGGQSASRKTEALAVTSSEARHWSSTRRIPASTGRVQSVWSGPVRQSCLVPLLAADSSPRPARPLEISRREYDMNLHH